VTRDFLTLAILHCHSEWHNVCLNHIIIIIAYLRVSLLELGNELVAKRSLWPKQCSKQPLWTASSTEAHCRLERSFVGPSTDDDVRNSVFVYGLTALNNVAVSWPHCKSARFEEERQGSERLCDRNARSHLSAAAAAGTTTDGGVTPGANSWLMRTRLSMPTTSPMTSRHVGGKAKTRAGPELVAYGPEVSGIGSFRSAPFRCLQSASVIINVEISVIISLHTVQRLMNMVAPKHHISCCRRWQAQSITVYSRDYRVRLKYRSTKTLISSKRRNIFVWNFQRSLGRKFAIDGTSFYAILRNYATFGFQCVIFKWTRSVICLN